VGPGERPVAAANPAWACLASGVFLTKPSGIPFTSPGDHIMDTAAVVSGAVRSEGAPIAQSE
jgi:hypothetical protein